MKIMQTSLLRTFMIVSDKRSFTKAGEVLGRTQPAISLQIKQLEDIVCTPLVDREGGVFRLTAAGEQLAIYARQMLLLHNEALSRIQHSSTAGSVRVGLPNDFAVSLLPEVLTGFIEKNPNVDLDVNCDISRNLLQGLQAGRHDVIVAMTAEQAHPVAAKLWSERLSWVTSASPRLKGECPVPLVVYPEGCVYRKRMIEALSRAGLSWRITCTTPSLSSLQAAVGAGLGVTVLSASTVPIGLAAISTQSVFPSLPDAIVGVYYNHESLSAASQYLINFLIKQLDFYCHSSGGDRHIDGTPAA